MCIDMHVETVHAVWFFGRIERALEEAQRQQEARHLNLGLRGGDGRRRGGAGANGDGFLLYQAPQLRYSDQIERASVIGLTSQADHLAVLDVITACPSVPRVGRDTPRTTTRPRLSFTNLLSFSSSGCIANAQSVTSSCIRFSDTLFGAYSCMLSAWCPDIRDCLCLQVGWEFMWDHLHMRASICRYMCTVCLCGMCLPLV